VQVHQFHPTVSYGDAISNQVLSLQGLLRKMGYRSEIFCEQLPIQFEGRARLVRRYDRHSSPRNVLLLHFSLGYPPNVIAWLRQLPDQKVIVYHNITPHTYFAGTNDVYLEAARAGREQLRQLSGMVDAGWGVSTFNCRELAECGWSKLGVLPIIFDPKRYEIRPHRGVLRQWQDGLNVLFVGRVSPNKCLEDLILTFHYLKGCVRPDARLLLVGSAKGMEPYLEFLQALASKLSLSEVIFPGHVSNEELMAYYRCADVYLSMSEHEGFGMPLLESMYFGVPVIAYKAAAVPETLNGSGILVKEKDHAAVGELIGFLGDDKKLQGQIIVQQHERLQDFLPERVEDQLRDLLHEFDSKSDR
jgi:glycosyltransferase involved in cell wall biosynthesis